MLRHQHPHECALLEVDDVLLHHSTLPGQDMPACIRSGCVWAPSRYYRVGPINVGLVLCQFDDHAAGIHLWHARCIPNCRTHLSMTPPRPGTQNNRSHAPAMRWPPHGFCWSFQKWHLLGICSETIWGRLVWPYPFRRKSLSKDHLDGFCWLLGLASMSLGTAKSFVNAPKGHQQPLHVRGNSGCVSSETSMYRTQDRQSALSRAGTSRLSSISWKLHKRLNGSCKADHWLNTMPGTAGKAEPNCLEATRGGKACWSPASSLMMALEERPSSIQPKVGILLLHLQDACCLATAWVSVFATIIIFQS